MTHIDDKIRLSLPARASYARTVRMLAANLSAVLRMNIEEVEDVRMAAEEAFILACESNADMLDLEFTLHDEVLSMEFSLGPDDITEVEAYQYADLILQAVSKTYTLTDKSLYLEMSIGGVDEFK